MRLVPYDAAHHRDGCAALFEGHVGASFSSDERGSFLAFLDDLPGPYLVGIQGDEVVACGGIAFENEHRSLASLCWTIVAVRRQRQGLGRQLIGACVAEAVRDGRCRAVRLETTPETSPFFQRLGFRVVHTERDGYGPGLARVEMKRELATPSPSG